MLVCPGNNPIDEATLSAWRSQNGLGPFDQLSADQSAEIDRIALGDPATISALADREVERAAKRAEEAALESAIVRITGFSRAEVMASAKATLRDARGYWPTIEADSLIVRSTGDKAIRWALGESAWSKPFSTQGSREDGGSGYGRG